MFVHCSCLLDLIRAGILGYWGVYADDFNLPEQLRALKKLSRSVKEPVNWPKRDNPAIEKQLEQGWWVDATTEQVVDSLPEAVGMITSEVDSLTVVPFRWRNSEGCDTGESAVHGATLAVLSMQHSGVGHGTCSTKFVEWSLPTNPLPPPPSHAPPRSQRACNHIKE